MLIKKCNPLTPETVDRKKRCVGWRWWVSKREADVIARGNKVPDVFYVVICCPSFNTLGSQLSILKRSDGVRPSLEGTVNKTPVHPWGDLIQLHPWVVGVVASAEVVAIPEKRNDSV